MKKIEMYFFCAGAVLSNMYSIASDGYKKAAKSIQGNYNSRCHHNDLAVSIGRMPIKDLKIAILKNSSSLRELCEAVKPHLNEDELQHINDIILTTISKKTDHKTLQNIFKSQNTQITKLTNMQLRQVQKITKKLNVVTVATQNTLRIPLTDAEKNEIRW